MAATFANANARIDGSDLSGGDGNLSVSPPANLAENDLWLILACGDFDAGGTISLPSGFTAVHDTLYGAGGYPGQRWMWKKAGASESAVDVYMENVWQRWAISIRVTGQNQTTPIGNVATSNPGDNTVIDAPDITVQTDGSLGMSSLTFHPLSASATGITVPGTTTSITERESSGFYAQGACAYEARNAGTWSLGNYTLDQTRGRINCVTFEILPADGAINETHNASAAASVVFDPTLNGEVAYGESLAASFTTDGTIEGSSISSVRVDRGRTVARGSGRGFA